MQNQQPIRRKQFAAAIASATRRPQWQLAREGWNGGTDSTPITVRDVTKNTLFEQFCRAMDFIETIDVTRTINPTASITSRDLKAYYETVCQRRNTPDHTYACNGAFILAAIATGLANAGLRRELSSSRLKVSKRAWKQLTKPAPEDDE